MRNRHNKQNILMSFILANGKQVIMEFNFSDKKSIEQINLLQKPLFTLQKWHIVSVFVNM